MITNFENWSQSQSEELNAHLIPFANFGLDSSFNTYLNSYNTVLKYLNVNLSALKDKSILEIGPALFSVGLYIDCKKFSCIEPLFEKFPNEIKKLYENKNIKVFTDPAEEFLHYSNFDEIWIFNLLQHVVNPELILSKCKESNKTLRIFEPINTPTDSMHPHSLSVKFFRDILGESFGEVYSGGSLSNFHSADCIYGTYN